MATFKQMVSNWLLGEYPVRTTQITTTPSGDNGLIQHVRLTDDSGNYVSSSGGTQYVEGATEATPTGTVALGKDSSNVLRTLEIDGSGNLNVNVAAGGAGDGAILDGANSAIKATVLDLTSSNPLTTAIVDATGAQISSFGGGTQYTEGDTSATIVGTVAMMEGSANTLLPVQGTVADGLLVNLGANNDVTVAGVSTAANQTSEIALLTTIDADTGNIATSTASIDGKITACNTGAVVVASSALPTGASTAAKQPALGTAGTASTDVITVQGIAAMTPLLVNGSGSTQPVSGTVTVTQATGTNLHTVVDSGTITTVSTVTAVTAITNALPAGNNNIGDVDVASCALPTGAATLAEQQTQTASLSVLDDWDESDRAKVNLIVGQAGVAAGVGATGATVQRVVQANDAGKTILSATGSASSSGNNTIVSAGSAKLKVFAFSLSTTSTTAVTVKFQSGASGTDLWSVILQAPTSVSTGANLSVALPAYLFATASATLLNLNLSGAIAVQWAVSYIDEA